MSTTAAKFKAALDELQNHYFNADVSPIRAQVDALIAEVVADAERYQWLRHEAPGEIVFDHTEGQSDGGDRFVLTVPFDGEPINNDMESAQRLDAAIDAARATPKETT